jgi:RNA polymerase sigma-70 factor (ECF subfamily)
VTDLRRPAQSNSGSKTSEAGGPAPASTDAEFRAVYEAEFSYVWQSLRRLGVREKDLEDLAHDVFITAFRRRADYDPTRPLRPWLFGICYRQASDFRRRAYHSRELGVDAPEISDGERGADDAIASEQDRQLLLRALESLDDGKRVVFVMHELNEHTMPEIAETLGIPLNSAYSRLRLARGELGTVVKRLLAQRGDG